MKKIFLLLISIITIFSLFIPFSFSGETALGECRYDVDGGITDVGGALNNCLGGSNLVGATNLNVTGGNFGTQIKDWANNIALYLGIFAVGSIVFGALMMTLSTGEDEKIKKAKDVIKWGIIGFLGLISAAGIINLIIKIMYSI